VLSDLGTANPPHQIVRNRPFVIRSFVTGRS
jgi:hypothetical protein